MPPSRSRVEREDPPPRRKSCHACVKAKRRCDQRQPACRRCSQRSIACCYPSRPARSEAAPTDPSPVTLAAPGSDFIPDDASLNQTLMDVLVPPFHVEPANHPWSSRKSPCLHQLELPWTPAEDLDVSIEATSATNLGLAVDEHGILGDENFDTELFFNFTDSTPTGKEIAARPSLEGPYAPRRVDLAGLHAALETNFSYAMDRIKAAPSNMLLENQTPWCHPLLFKETMPRVMQGKFTSI